MAIKIEGMHVSFCPLSLSLKEYPTLLLAFDKKNESTKLIESMGQHLVQDGVTEQALKEFIRNVCNWGGYPGVSGNIVKNNDAGHLVDIFKNVIDVLSKNHPISALRVLLEVKNLGISFGSKHVKFLAPDQAVVLDSIISSRLGYPLDQKDLNGYSRFLDDCRLIRDLLKEHDIPCPDPAWRKDGWRISDVEMAIYQAITGSKQTAQS